VDSPGIEFRGGGIFSPVQNGPWGQTASSNVGAGSLPAVKRPERDVDHPPPSSAEVKETVELYL